MTSHTGFPAAIYAETVLSVNFTDAQRYFLEALFEIHYAHTLMLARQGIIANSVARKLLEGLDALQRPDLSNASYDGRFEDLFFFVEGALEQACGTEIAGHMHTARSRNDIDITQYRMKLRRDILQIARVLTQARRTLLDLSREHILTLMPAYTHTQPAQPTTLAHYLLAVVELFSRDQKRLEAAFATVNRNPLGACAIATTGFPIDRDFTAELLGFEGLQLNSYGAIAATDYLAETAGMIATMMLNLGKVTQDLLLWSTAEFGFLQLSDAWVQISSIMPQKRNPVALEHTRILASKALAHAQGLLLALHNTPFGDVVDSEDDVQPLVFSMTSDAIRALTLFGGVLTGCVINTDRMAERAHADFLTVTELADTLVREEDVSFRQAHHLVSEAVRHLRGQYSVPRMVDAVIALAPVHFDRPLRTAHNELARSLDPLNFITVRRVPGGPAPDMVRAAIGEAESDLASTERWIAEKSALLDGYPALIEERRRTLIGGKTDE